MKREREEKDRKRESSINIKMAVKIPILQTKINLF